MHNERPDGKFLLGMFLGGVIGAGIIFFVETKEGKKTAKMLGRKGKEVLDDLEEKVEDLEEKGKELIEKGEEIKERVIDKMKDAAGDVSEEASERLDKALEKLEDVQKGSLQTTASIRKHFVNLPKRK
jgi:gas vesicle protein